MGIPDHVTCLLRNLYAGQQQLQLGIEQQTDSKSGKEYVKTVYGYILRNTGLEEAQAGIKIAGRNINNLDKQMTPPLWQKVKKN